ncbi:MAG: PfkB family carbohydrate kinase [Actinomycetaceae bacterium]|nr:PfkB family carbohydrate kinase [Actinomycetaceae bacterium]MDY6082648.1 PfkB family carbohydrate kinase [Actinomycetaceae bacterium]
MGRVIHTGQAIVDIVLHISQLPERGGDIFADRFELTAGGGFNVMAAARRAGAEVVYAGQMGRGPLAAIVRHALAGEGIELSGAEPIDEDSGFSVAFVEQNAERTFVSTRGAETHQRAESLNKVVLADGDVIYVSGYSLVHSDSCQTLVTWLSGLREGERGVRVVVDPSPVIADIPDRAWDVLMQRANIWSLNERETRLALERCGGTPTGDALSDASAFASKVPGAVVSRLGAQGAIVVQGGALTRVPAYPVTSVDSNGAGDAHTGYLCALLAGGEHDLVGAVHMANIAAAVAVTREGPATAPALVEVQGYAHTAK